jgi:hypothetical protein
MYGNQNYPYSTTYGNYPNYLQRSYMTPNNVSQPVQNQMQQPMQMQPQAPVAYDMPIQDIKFVNKAQAEAYIVFPNTKVMLIDNESGIVYLKTADGMGQCKTDHYKFEQINADGSPIKPQDPPPQINLEEFVKVEQIKSFGFVTFEQYNKVLDELEDIKRQISANKSVPKVATTKGG